MRSGCAEAGSVGAAKRVQHDKAWLVVECGGAKAANVVRVVQPEWPQTFWQYDPRSVYLQAFRSIQVKGHAAL